MNARERRKLKRIRLRCRDHSPQSLNRHERLFVVSHTPPPKRICVMSDAESQRFHDVTIGHRCTSTSHRHYSRKQVDILVDRGELTWIGLHHKIASWTHEKTWAKVDSGGFSVMQLVAGLRR